VFLLTDENLVNGHISSAVGLVFDEMSTRQGEAGILPCSSTLTQDNNNSGNIKVLFTATYIVK